MIFKYPNLLPCKAIVNFKGGGIIVTYIQIGVRSGSFRSFYSNSYSFSMNNNNDKLLQKNQGKSLVNKIFITPKLSLIIDDKVNQVEARNELCKLKEKIDRRNSLRKQIVTLGRDIDLTAEDFVGKYSKFQPVLGNLDSYLDKTISKDTLIQYLEQQGDDYKEVLSLLSKNSAGSVQMGNFSLNQPDPNNYQNFEYNTQLLDSYGEFISDFDSMEFHSGCNYLSDNSYLISDKLEHNLINA